MQLATIIKQYQPRLKSRYRSRLLPGHQNAMAAMLRCRTHECGEITFGCSECTEQLQYPQSCGHRSCPKCQNHDTSVWLDRQSTKLLPVEYFLVTLTLPRELRALTWCHQKKIYALVLSLAAKTLKDFGLNPKLLGGDIGLTAVLHTHSRRLDYHPHVHLVVPGGAVNQRRKQWQKVKGKYLFNERALARVFRARLLAAIKQAGLMIPNKLPAQWVADVRHVGQGLSALQYLSRYLYRGVISEKNIVSNRDGRVTFKYIDSKTNTTQYRSLKGEDFLWLLLQHVLPSGFRRVRDYGFLHGNAKKNLLLVQFILKVFIINRSIRSRPVIKCPACQAPMRVVRITKLDWPSG